MSRDADKAFYFNVNKEKCPSLVLNRYKGTSLFYEWSGTQVEAAMLYVFDQSVMVIPANLAPKVPIL